MRQLQQQEGPMGRGDAPPNSPHRSQFRLPSDHNTPLPLLPTRGSRNNEMDASKLGADREPQDSQTQHMPRVNSIDGLHQLQGADNMTALNSLLQQQQQHSSVPNNPLQQQLQPQNCRLNEQPLSLKDNLLQLQKLQEQQQQILKNISQNTGLVDPNGVVNPLGTLLNTLIGQMGGNNTGNNSNNTGSGAMNRAHTSAMGNDPNNNNAVAWGQMGGDLLNNQGGILPSMLPPIQQQQQPAFVGRSNAPLNAPRPLRMPTTSRQTVEEGKRYPPSHGLARPNVGRGPSRVPGPNSNTNINIEFPSAPLIRKTETKKKQKPKAFPQQLWDAMMTEGPMNDAAFEWLPDGKSFVVVDSAFFCKEILDRKFKQSKYGSFVRKLHRWGFIRLTSGTGTDCFHHPLFQRYRPELVSEIKCNSRNGKDGNKKGHNAYARIEYQDSVQPSLMGVEKFIRAKVVSTENEEDLAL